MNVDINIIPGITKKIIPRIRKINAQANVDIKEKNVNIGARKNKNIAIINVKIDNNMETLSIQKSKNNANKTILIINQNNFVNS